MTRRTLFLRVGALLVGSVALLVGLIVVLTGDRLTNGHAYETYFRESVQGLDVGAPVKYRGVTLGRVTNIGLVSAEYGATENEQIMDATYRLIVVRFKIDPKRVGHLPQNTVAVRNGLRTRLASQGLTGVAYLELDFVPPEKFPATTVPWLPQDDYVPSIPSTLAQVQDAATKLLTKIDSIDMKGLADNLDGLVSDLRDELAMKGGVHATLDAAQATLTALRTEAQRADIPALTAQLQKTASAVETLAQGKQTKALLDQANASLARIPPLIAALQTTVSRTGNSVGDIQAELVPILRDAKATLQNFRETSEALRRDPGALLWQGPPPRGTKP